MFVFICGLICARCGVVVWFGLVSCGFVFFVVFGHGMLGCLYVGMLVLIVDSWHEWVCLLVLDCLLFTFSGICC